MSSKSKNNALEQARKRRDQAIRRIASLEQQNQNYCRLLGCMLRHCGAEALSFKYSDLDEMDPDRIYSIEMQGHFILGIKANASDPLVIPMTEKRVAKALDAVSEEPAHEPG